MTCAVSTRFLLSVTDRCKLCVFRCRLLLVVAPSILLLQILVVDCSAIRGLLCSFFAPSRSVDSGREILRVLAGGRSVDSPPGDCGCRSF
ncbi:hypothetical protein R1flu_016936 [Riccia fluitans]|uniref:Secreted protein n=1 Tax=Riccia fluitans TaxID=41844 RepID=A0ABD1YNM2_9MARC